MNRSVQDRTPYHWALLALCATHLLVFGVASVVGGSSPSSHFHAIDDYVVRAIGLLLIISAPALLFRWNWAFTVAIAVLAFSMLEIAVTFNPAASHVPVGFEVVWTLVLVGLPIWLLNWLRPVFVPSRG